MRNEERRAYDMHEIGLGNDGSPECLAIEGCAGCARPVSTRSIVTIFTNAAQPTRHDGRRFPTRGGLQRPQPGSGQAQSTAGRPSGLAGLRASHTTKDNRLKAYLERMAISKAK